MKTALSICASSQRTTFGYTTSSLPHIATDEYRIWDTNGLTLKDKIRRIELRRGAILHCDLHICKGNHDVANHLRNCQISEAARSRIDFDLIDIVPIALDRVGAAASREDESVRTATTIEYVVTTPAD